MLGLNDNIGSIAKGKLTGIIAVEGKLLEIVSALKKAKMVMKDGTVYRNDSDKSF